MQAFWDQIPILLWALLLPLRSLRVHGTLQDWVPKSLLGRAVSDWGSWNARSLGLNSLERHRQLAEGDRREVAA